MQSHPGMHPQVIITFFTAAESVKVFSVQGLMNDRRFQGLPTVGQSLSSGCTANPSKEAEMSDSDDGGLSSVRKIIARSKQAIEL